MARYRSKDEDISIEPEELAERYPRLFHMATVGNWPSIKRHGLLNTSALLVFFDVLRKRRVESRHRSMSEEIRHPGLGHALVRDWKPVGDKALCKCSRDGLKPCDWYKTLNSKVFFWPTRSRLEGMLSARPYTEQRHTVLTIDTAILIADHSERVALSPVNSGSTLFNPTPRSRDTFLPPDRYPFRARRRKIAELAVESELPNIRDHGLLVEERQVEPPKSIRHHELGAVSPCAGRS